MASDVDKLVLTNRPALATKYGAAVARIEVAFGALVVADADRGLQTHVHDLADVAAMDEIGGTAVSSLDPKQHKDAIDAAFRWFEPDYLMLVGSLDLIPHQPLQNPLFAAGTDPDELIPSDIPYACEAPFGSDATEFIGPTRVVGRLPDLTGGSDPSVLVRLLERATTWERRARAAYDDHLGISAEIWAASTELSLTTLFGTSAELHLSPDEGPGWADDQLKRRVHFVNCHGAGADPRYYGQRGSDYPVAHDAALLADKLTSGTIVAAECCYGAQLFDAAKAGGQPPMPIVYLANGADAFFGSSTVAYGPAHGNAAADLVCQYFIAATLAGTSTGRAALQARQRFVHETNVVDPADLKTLAQFSLFGDPSVHPVATEESTAPAASKAVPGGRSDRRQRLLEVGIANLRDTKVPHPDTHTETPNQLRDQLRAASNTANLTDEQFLSFSFDDPPLVRAGILPRSSTLTETTTSTFRVLLATGPTSRLRSQRPSPSLPRGQRPPHHNAHPLRQVTAQEVRTGLVVKEPFAVGSKSERDAVLLVADDERYLLRREGGNPFADPALDALVGQRVTAHGVLQGTTFIICDWSIVP